MSKATIILIAGPTASGKSALALDLAHKNNGIIINTDALQIYNGLPLLSAQPSKEALKAVPHKLYGTLAPYEKSSAGIWQRLAEEEVRKALTQGKTPLLVGGTGLYFRAFFGGLAEIPDIPEDVRHQVIKLYDTLGEEEFRKKLAEIDSASAARLKKNDKQRLIRAYEVALHTGKPLSDWHKNDHDIKALSETWNIQSHLLLPSRDELYKRCDQRFEMMMREGAEEEVRTLLDLKLSTTLPVMKTIGVREIGDFLSGQCTREEAIEKARQATRNYAKRQMTWFRNQWKF